MYDVIQPAQQRKEKREKNRQPRDSNPGCLAEAAIATELPEPLLQSIGIRTKLKCSILVEGMYG